MVTLHATSSTFVSDATFHSGAARSRNRNKNAWSSVNAKNTNRVPNSAKHTKQYESMRKSTGPYVGPYRTLYFSNVHLRHCACPRPFNKSNMLPPWVETKNDGDIRFWISDVNKSVMLPYVCSPAPMYTSTQVLFSPPKS